MNPGWVVAVLLDTRIKTIRPRLGYLKRVEVRWEMGKLENDLIAP